MIDKYSVEWLQDAIYGLVDRKIFDGSTLAFLEAIAARPEGLTELLCKDSIAKSLAKKIEHCAQPESDTAHSWAAIADNLLGVATQPEAIFDEMEKFAAFGHAKRTIGCIEKMPPSWRREAAGRALVYAARDEHWNFANDLIEMGADCKFQFPDGSTALIYAARWGNLALVRKLLANGADLGARDSDGDTAIDLAGSPMIRRYLEKLAAQGKD